MRRVLYYIFVASSVVLFFLISEFTLSSAYNLTHNERINTWPPVDNYPRDPENYIKIAIFGESAAYGYNSERSFANILEYELKKRFPALKLYFYNYALQGNTFHRNQAEICKMVIKNYDIFIIYAGNNEPSLYWDDMGYFRTAKYKNHKTLSGYNYTFGKKIISSIVSFLETKSRIYAILKKARNRLIKQKPNSKPAIKSYEFYQYRKFNEFEPVRILPEQEYEKIIVNFGKDLEEIARLADKYNKDVILASIPVNESIKPFFSTHRTGLNNKGLEMFQKNYDRGLELYKENNFKAAVPYFSAAADIDDSVAILDYMLGFVYLKEGEIEKGREFLIKSSDNDGFPLRAFSGFSKIEKAISERHKSVTFIDAAKIFHTLHKENYTYDDIFSDIHHPNLLGHIVLSRNFLEKILEMKPFTSNRSAQNYPLSMLTDYRSLLAEYKNELKVTSQEEANNAFGIARWFLGLSALSAYGDDYLGFAKKYLDIFYVTSSKNGTDKVLFFIFSALVEAESSKGDIEKALNLGNEAVKAWSTSKEKAASGIRYYVENIVGRSLPLGDLVIERFNKAGILYSFPERRFAINRKGTLISPVKIQY